MRTSPARAEDPDGIVAAGLRRDYTMEVEAMLRLRRRKVNKSASTLEKSPVKSMQRANQG
jgi:hypothetical protein